MPEKKYFAKTNTAFFYALAFVIGVLVGIRSLAMFVALMYVLISVACVFLAFRGDSVTVLKVLPYLIYTEIFIRAFATFIPYLFVQYVFTAVFSILLLKKSITFKMHSRAFVLIILFIIIEFVNSFKATDQDMVRAIFTNSICLVIMTTWGSFNFIKPVVANSIMNNIKYAGIYLCGMILVRYLMGDIVFVAYSNSETTNGLAPVQISGYLGFSCAVFFLSIMNDNESRNMLLNLILISVNAVVMILSFSRGGVYFLGVIMALHFFFNRAHAKSYLILLLLIPIALGVYLYVSERTHGLIEQRYAQEGSSGRDELVKAGWTLFIEEPVAGVGTGNFGPEIEKRGLYSMVSGAHNEFIRVAAEHGILGIITYWGFFIFLIVEILKRKGVQREYGIYFLVFFCMIVVHNGLKISLQPFLLMLAVATPSLVKAKKKIRVPAAPKFAPGY